MTREESLRSLARNFSTRNLYAAIHEAAPRDCDTVGKEFVKAMKHEVRSRVNLKDKYNTRGIRSDSDGYLVLFEMADEDAFADEAEANAYFEDEFRIRMAASPYDCTGQRFTEWYKCFRRNGKWMAYHSVGIDV